MGVGALEKKGGKFDVNGLIKDYYVYAGENISAGSFVEFINGVAGQTTKESSAVQIGEVGGDTRYAIAIDEKTVFIVFCYGGYYRLYSVVVKIDNGVITAGTDTVLSSTNYSANRLIKPVLLPNGAVFIIHNSSNDIINCMICEIEGLVPVKKKSATIASNEYVAMDMSGVLLSKNQIFIAHSYDNKYYLYGIVVTIGEDYSITKGTDTALSSGTSYYGYRINTGLLETGKVIVAHASNNVNTGNKLMAKVCTIDGTTVTYGNSTLLDSDISSGKTINALHVLQQNKAVILHRADTDNALCATLVTVDGDSIAVEMQQDITTNYEEAGGAYSSSILLKDNKVFIAGRGDSSGGILSIVIIDVDIDNNIITQGVDTIITTPLSGSNSDGYAVSCEKIDDDIVFVCYGSTKYGQLFGVDYENNLVTTTIKVKQYETQVRNVTSSNANGIAKTSGIGGSSTGHNESVQVYVPDWMKERNLVINGDFSNDINDWTAEGVYTLKHDSNGCMIAEVSSPSSVKGSTVRINNTAKKMPANHVYYGRFDMKGETTNKLLVVQLVLRYSSGDIQLCFNENYTSTEWTCASGVFTPTVETEKIGFIMTAQNPDGNLTAGMRIYLDNIVVYDLTEMFGAGNEPTKEWCDANL